MKSFATLAAFVFLCVLCLHSVRAQSSEYEKLKIEAEKLFADKSFALAHDLYVKADALTLPSTESRWVKFRLADTLWRAQASTQTSDTSKFEEAQKQLDVLVRDLQKPEEHDRVWVEVQESLGDFWWMRRDSRNWYQAWTNYQLALDWWAGTADVELARNRYIAIVFKAANPNWGREYGYYYGSYGMMPLDIIENVLKIARSDNDKAQAHYLMAMTLRYQGGDWEQRRRIPEDFEAALKLGKSTDWYDDALYYYAEWIKDNGRVVPLPDGNWRQEQDYVKALELFRRLVTEFQKGETRYYDPARQEIENITKPVVGVSVSNIYLPDSEIQINLNWRNVKKVDLTIYKVDLNRDVQFTKESNRNAGEWLQQIDLLGREKVKAWSKDTADKGDYKPGQETIRLDTKLPTGAYLIEAQSADVKAREIILVTDTTLVLKQSKNQVLAYFCNATDGSPIAEANVSLWQRNYVNGNWADWQHATRQTNPDGLAVMELPLQTYENLFVSASINGRQAFCTTQNYNYYDTEQAWRVYVTTDRPAYRPGETMQWKYTVRKYNEGVYSTPANQTIEYEIRDPRGSKVKDGKAKLNQFGSAWDSLELTETMPLGEYQVQFWDEGKRIGIGNAKLFRLEEYKLPEFKVSVSTPEENGRKKAFRLGEKVEVRVQADYYFGGPVANGTAEVLVYQKQFYHWYAPPREYPWFYDERSPYYYYSQQEGQIIKRETLKTDATGKATLTFDTPRQNNQDYEYRIEARVTDSSRREIIGSDTVRVTKQRFYVYPRAKHSIYHPQDKVAVDFKALDANNQPVQAQGTIKVTRQFYRKVWYGREGKELSEDEAKTQREKGGVYAGYIDEHDDILTTTAKTNAEGEAEFTFTPEREGYYSVVWSSPDTGNQVIQGSTTVWVANKDSNEIGYRTGNLSIIVDKDTFRVGQPAPVMLCTPTNDRYVLFSVEGDDLYSYQLVHLTGNVKLVEVQIQAQHVPNIFLSAAMVSDRQLSVDTKEVVVPPTQQFLKVDVKSDREQYQPREEGTLTVSTLDQNGKPIAAEVALGLVDESVYYIQQDYAGDPRQFFYGRKRQNRVNLTSTFQLKRYIKLVEDKNKSLVDQSELYRLQVDERLNTHSEEAQRQNEQTALRGGGIAFSTVGGKSSDMSAGNLAASPIVEAQKNASGYKELDDRLAKKADGLEIRGDKDKGKELQETAVQVRSDFRSTIFWQPDVVTDSQGKATVKVKYPDSLTSWKATARAFTENTQVGIAETSTRTKQPLIVRLQAPRFFVAGDLTTVSAVINNNTDKPMTVAPTINTEGIAVTGIVVNGKYTKGEQGSIKVEANGEARADWVVYAQKAGNAKLKVTGRGGQYADAMERSYTIFEHGIEKFISKSGKVRGNDVSVVFNIPKERKIESTTLNVQVTPSMAVTMLDSLPYLIDYPYGCTEQTMSRFLPAVITAKTLKDLGLKPEDVMGKIFGGIEPATADKTHPKGAKDLAKLDEMTRKGLERLYDFQHSDGGWGWWKQGESDHFMTAYVVWGMTLAHNAKVKDLKYEALSRGATYLDKELVEEELNYDVQAWMLHALSSYYGMTKQTLPSKFQVKAFDNLWNNRERLNAYSRSLLALAAHNYGFDTKAKSIILNLENGVKIDLAPDTSIIERTKQPSNEAVIGTAHWGEDGIYWRWSDGGVEATAFGLMAFLAIEPKSKLIEPVTNWLIKNRRGAQWSNTRDTAITVLAMNDYLSTSGELATNLEYELSVNGHPIATKKITPAEVLTAPSQFAINPAFLQDGNNEVRIVKRNGSSALYFALQAKFFSLECPIPSEGHEIFVRRDYYKIVSRPTLLKGYVYDKQPLNDQETVTSGDRVEVVLTIEAKNNYEYLIFEDLKPAGLEAVQIRSGEALYVRELKSSKFKVQNSKSKDTFLNTQSSVLDYTGRNRWVYQELRDRKVALFIDKLPEGVWEIRYELRAETPGAFHALPVVGHAMYVPEIRCNGEEIRIKVEDTVR